MFHARPTCSGVLLTAALAAAPLAAAAQTTWEQCGSQFLLPPRPVFDVPDDPDPEATYVSADEVAGREGERTTLRGDVEVQRGTRQLQADEVVYNEADEVLDATGNMRIWDEGLFVHGARGRLEMESDVATVDEGTYLIEDAHGRGTAERVTMSGRELVRIQDASYTTCPEGREDWLLTASEIELDRVDDIGTARNVVVDFKGVPVFYTPYITFPLSDERKSGVLTPSMRVSGSTGVEATVPYYFNLAPNYDATLALRGMSERGMQAQGEFRWLTEHGEGRAQAEVLPDDDAFGDGRLAFHLRHTGDVTSRLYTDVDFNWVSDAQYFEDLGTNLAIAGRTHVERRGDLRYRGVNFSALARVQEYQTLDAAIAAEDLPYERLPQLQLSYGAPERNRQLNWRVSSEFVHFDRRSSVTGARVDVRPSVSLPIRTAAAFVEPRADLRYTAYALDGTSPAADDAPSRLLPTFSVDSGLFFERDLELGGGGYVQTLEPRAYYLLVPFDDQSDLPVFDTGEYSFSFAQLFRTDRFSGTDRVGDAHQVTLALTSRLLDARGQEILRGSIGQIRYFSDRRVQLPGVNRAEDDSSAFVAEVAASAGAWRLTGGIQWDPNDDRTDKHTWRVRYKPDSQRVVNAAYRFVRGTIEQADISAAWPVAANWRAVGRWNYALARGTTLESFAGFEYESCCWAFRTVARRYLTSSGGEHENAIFLQLELKGLTGVGRGTGEFLERSIPGFENPF